MSKVSEMSPKQVVKMIFKIWVVFMLLSLGSCYTGNKLDDPYSVKTSHNATLELAYSSMQKCGKTTSCEQFMGRFKLEDGTMIDREIDGFFYYRFVEEGRKPLASYVTVSKNQQGIRTPGWIVCLMIFGAFGLIVSAFSFIFFLGLVDGLDEEEKAWEREQERKARDRRYM